jgi:hypothetical protein
VAGNAVVVAGVLAWLGTWRVVTQVVGGSARETLVMAQVSGESARKVVAGVTETAVSWPEVPRQADPRMARSAVGWPEVPREAETRVARSAVIARLFPFVGTPWMATATMPLPRVRPSGPRATEAAVGVVAGEPGPVPAEPAAAPETAEHASRSRTHLHDCFLRSPYRRHNDDISPCDRRQPSASPLRWRRNEEGIMDAAEYVLHSPLFYDNYGTPQVTPATVASILPELRENCRRIAVLEAKIDYVAGALARIEAKLDGRPDLTPPRT